LEMKARPLVASSSPRDRVRSRGARRSSPSPGRRPRASCVSPPGGSLAAFHRTSDAPRRLSTLPLTPFNAAPTSPRADVDPPSTRRWTRRTPPRWAGTTAARTSA
jgi:hypothetical protein